MKIISPNSWNEFVNELENIRSEFGIYQRKLPNGDIFEANNLVLFRGQPNAELDLETTLERKTDKKIHILNYMHMATKYSCEIESYTNSN